MMQTGLPFVRRRSQKTCHPPKFHHRSLFLSDLHIGAKGCRIDAILAFLRDHSADTIYLVGDIFDNWQPIGSKWSPEHHEVVRILIDRFEAGARIIYTPGNHDAFLRQHYGTYFETVEVIEQKVHIAADGKSYLVVHGDCCDVFVGRARWLFQVGSAVDSVVRGVDGVIKTVRRALELNEWNWIERTLLRVNRMIRYGDRYEERLCSMARRAGVDGIICGHFHNPQLHDDHGVTYANCGEWFDSCTAIVEDDRGGLKLLSMRARAATGELTAPDQVADDATEVTG